MSDVVRMVRVNRVYLDINNKPYDELECIYDEPLTTSEKHFPLDHALMPLADYERLRAAVDASAEVIRLEDDDDPCEDASGNLDMDKMDDYQRQYNATVERWVAATRRALDAE